MEFLLKKKYLGISFFCCLLLGIISYVYFINRCFGETCGSDLIRGTLMPVFWLSTALTPLIFIFFFFHESIFKSWLKHVAWWYGLGLFFVTITTPVYSSNILSLDRSQVVFGGVVLLALITVPYILLRRHKISVAFES